MNLLFAPITLRGTTFRNRIWVSPMCQYSSDEGRPTDWHLVHLGALARGGAGMVMTEATAVTPEGRITPRDAGIWRDDQAASYERIVSFLRSQGAVPAIQLAHAGRKASTRAPWLGRGYVEPHDGGWQTVGPSPIGYGDWPAPRELTAEELIRLPRAWAAAARRSADVGFEVAEIHAAHGYLLHEFLSPLTNRRADAWGGDLQGRSRLLFDVVDAVREAWPDARPLLVRVSATDWLEGGLEVNDVAMVAKDLAQRGVDLIDVSTGGNTPGQEIRTGRGYQVPFARQIKEASGLPVGAVGLITEPCQAEEILQAGQADVVFLGRELLRNPHWPQLAAAELGAEVHWPNQYLSARRDAAGAGQMSNNTRRGSRRQLELHELLRTRFSPLSFDADLAMTDAEVDLLVEAARWAPSAGNSQPWMFITALRGSREHALVSRRLAPSSARWARDASLLVVNVAHVLVNESELQYSEFADYDLGQAVAHMTLQAHALGLACRQFRAFDLDSLSQDLDVPAGWLIRSMTAVGRAAGHAPGRERRPLADLRHRVIDPAGVAGTRE